MNVGSLLAAVCELALTRTNIVHTEPPEPAALCPVLITNVQSLVLFSVLHHSSLSLRLLSLTLTLCLVSIVFFCSVLSGQSFLVDFLLFLSSL